MISSVDPLSHIKDDGHRRRRSSNLRIAVSSSGWFNLSEARLNSLLSLPSVRKTQIIISRFLKFQHDEREQPNSVTRA